MIYLEVRIKTEDDAIDDILDLLDAWPESPLSPRSTVRLELTRGMDALSLGTRARLDGIQRRLYPRLLLLARGAWNQPRP